MSLPHLTDIYNSDTHEGSPLSQTLSLLFESSPILHSLLVPQLASFQKGVPALATYSDLIDTALVVIRSWHTRERALFIAGHPRIGETKNLSSLSAKEQGQTSAGTTPAPTPPEVLARLAHLNACYEAKYPGLRYIIFVDGRSRQEVAEEMEKLLEIEHSLSPGEPTIASIVPIEVASDEWKAELDRAVHDIGAIAKSRLKNFNAQ